MKSFLIIQTAFIGDVVLATALVEKLRLQFPEADIDFLVRKGNEGLLAGHPYIREVLVWDKKGGKYMNLYQIWKKIRSRKYDHVVNVQRFAATGLVTAFSGATETIGFDKNPFSLFFSRKIRHRISTAAQPLHEVERNQELISHLTDARPGRPALYPGARDFEIVSSYKVAPYVCIAPASVWFTKQFPKDKWTSLIDEIDPDLHIFLIGAPADARLCEEILIGCITRSRVSNLCGKLSLLQSAALQKDARRNLVNDSAPMHFATAMNAPVTAIYCSTIPAFGYGPLSDARAIVETPEPLACRPCGLHGHKACPEGHFKCAYNIRNEQILGTIA